MPETANEFTITGINVPGDADLCVLLFTGYLHDLVAAFDISNFDGDTDHHFVHHVLAGDSDDTCAAISSLRYGQTGFPARGSSNITFTGRLATLAAFTGTRVTLFFISGMETGAGYLIGTDFDSNLADNWQSDPLGTVGANDVAIIAGVSWNNVVDATPAGAGQTEITQGNNGACNFGAGYELGEDQPSLTYTRLYSGAVAAAFKAAAAPDVQRRLPTGIGIIDDWSLGAGSSKVDAVDDPVGSPDEDAGYIYNDVGAYKSQYFTFSSFSISASSIEKVSVTTRFKYTGAGSGVDVRPRIRVNGTNYLGSVSGESGSYSDLTYEWTTNPNTGAAWTQDDVNGIGASPLQEVGVNGTNGTYTDIRVTQIIISVTYSPAAGGTTLAIDDLAHGHALDAIALTQKHNLAVADLLHGHTIDSVDLTIAVDLVIQSLAHGHSIETADLTQQHNLTINDLLHAHSLDAVSLSAAVLLEIANMVHGHSLDAVDLSQAHNLAVDDLLHGHQLEAPVLTQVHNLIASDLLHGHSIDQVTLSSAVNLVIDSLLHTHSIDHAVLTQVHVLAIDDLGHTHDLGAVDLTQAHNLVISDLFHSHRLAQVIFVTAKGRVTINILDAKQPTIIFGAAKQPEIIFN